MPSMATLKVSCARASEMPNATLMAGITGKNRCTASGLISAIDASANAKIRPGIMRLLA